MKNKIFYLPKFQNSGTLPGTIPDFLDWSKMSDAERFQVRMSPLYQFVQTVSSDQGKQNSQYSGNYYWTKTKDNPQEHWEFVRSEEPLQPMEQEIVEYLPGTGDVAEVANIGKDLSQGNIGNAMLAAGLLILPGNANKIKNKLNEIRLNTLIRNIANTPEFKYKVREYSRNQQLRKLIDYGPNSNILVHGDPAATGVKKINAAIGHSDGKLQSFPHFENGMFVPGKGQDLRIKQGEGTYTINNEDRPIFWGDGIPFFETRNGNESMFNDNEYINWLATRNKAASQNNPNDFILDHPYRYIATNRSSAKSPVTTHSNFVNRNATEIQTKEVPIDKIWGIEWDPLTQTWGKTIYSVNGTFHKQGGKLNENN